MMQNTVVLTNQTSEGSPSMIVVWICQLLGALAFFISGATKVAGADRMRWMFGALGLGQWFRYLTGITEIVGALMLLFGSLARVSATFLFLLMIGATISHFLVGGNPMPAVLLLIAMGIVAWGRRDRTAVLFRRKNAP